MGRKEKKEKDAERSPTCYKMEEEGEKFRYFFQRGKEKNRFTPSIFCLFLSIESGGGRPDEAEIKTLINPSKNPSSLLSRSLCSFVNNFPPSQSHAWLLRPSSFILEWKGPFIFAFSLV